MHETGRTSVKKSVLPHLDQPGFMLGSSRNKTPSAQEFVLTVIINSIVAERATDMIKPHAGTTSALQPRVPGYGMKICQLKTTKRWWCVE